MHGIGIWSAFPRDYKFKLLNVSGNNDIQQGVHLQRCSLTRSALRSSVKLAAGAYNGRSTFH